MKEYLNTLWKTIHEELHKIDMDDCDISTDEALKMAECLQTGLSDLREKFLEYQFSTEEEEISFFKEVKPELLSYLLYFNQIYNIQLKQPNGSDYIQKDYYEKELESLMHFFNHNLDFYQYYRSHSTYFDKFYFVRGNTNLQLCVDSTQFVIDPLFSTGYDLKVAKILSNEMLRIFLNKKIQSIGNKYNISNSRQGVFNNTLLYTGRKVWIVELGYSLYASGIFNGGKAEICDIMKLLENCFQVELKNYYRAYQSLKDRKKDPTEFLTLLMSSLKRYIDEED
jgi:hypothetical protein